MPIPILTLDSLLALALSDRRTAIEEAAREIDSEIDQLKAGRIQVMYGRSRGYHLQSLYARREQLVRLARKAGCDDWDGIPVEAA